MKEKFLNNIPLKIMSVAVAIVVWLLVVNIDDPIQTRLISDVKVQVLNEAYVESGGQMCLIEEGQDSITVQVTGNRKTLENLTAADIVATADMKQMIDLDTNPVMVPIAVSCSGMSQGNIQAIPRNMEVTIEEMMTQEFIVTVDTSEVQTGAEFDIGEATASPEKIEITGPQSLIKKIDRVVARVSLSGVTEDVNTRVSLVIYDRNQEQLTSTQMQYLKYDISEPTVDVAIKLWEVRDNVSISASYVGEPATGYKVDSLTFTPSEVRVAGTEEALEELAANGNKIEIPAESIDVTGKSEDFETRVDISQLLPEGLKLATGTSEFVIVRANVLPVGSKEYSIPTKNISIENVEEGLQAVCETEKVDIRVGESTASLDNLDESDIQLSVDLSGKTEGSYEVPVEVTLPTGYVTVSDAVVTIKLTELADTTDESE